MMDRLHDMAAGRPISTEVPGDVLDALIAVAAAAQRWVDRRYDPLMLQHDAACDLRVALDELRDTVDG